MRAAMQSMGVAKAFTSVVYNFFFSVKLLSKEQSRYYYVV